MKLRKATKEDCPGMLQLIRELAEYEKAPQEVTVDPKHFEESGFGENPVWWAFVVETDDDSSTPSTHIVAFSTLLYPLFHLERPDHVFGRHYRYRNPCVERASAGC